MCLAASTLAHWGGALILSEVAANVQVPQCRVVAHHVTQRVHALTEREKSDHE